MAELHKILCVQGKISGLNGVPALFSGVQLEFDPNKRMQEHMIT